MASESSSAPESKDLFDKICQLHEKYSSSLMRSLADRKAELESIRPGLANRKIPVVDEPSRSPEKCFRDFLLAEILWLQSDMASERKLKQGQAKKLGKELSKHKYVVDRREGVDVVEQNLRKVSSVLAGEVEKFWRGVTQLAEHRSGKRDERAKRSANQKKLDELVDRTERLVTSEPGSKRARVVEPSSSCGASSLVVDEKKKRVDEISMAMRSAQPTGDSFSTSKVSIGVPSLLRAQLREYQHIGMQWLATLHARGLNGILADEMGLGKTLQTIALLAHLACDQGIWGPHLIVVPTSVMINWEIEFKKFLPGFKVMVYFGTPKERRVKRVGWRDDNVFNVCICSYALVLQDALVFRKKNWHYLILDEAHQIKNFKSLRWQNLLTFKTDRRLLLTGTPLQNDLVELWSLLHFLMPSIFSSHLEFQEWFSDPLSRAIEESSIEQHSGLIASLHALIRPFLLRRLKKDVETQMPSKYEHVIPVALSVRQKVLYDEFLSHRQNSSSSSSYLGLMNILMQLRKVCNHPDLLEPRPVRSPLVMVEPIVFDFFPKSVDHDEDKFSKKSLLFDTFADTFPKSCFRTECVDHKRSGNLLGKVWKHKQALLDASSVYLENEYIARTARNLPALELVSPSRSAENLGVKADTVRFIRSMFSAQKPPCEIDSSFDRWKRFACRTLPVLVRWKSDLDGRSNNVFEPKTGEDFLCKLPDKAFLEFDCGKFRVLRPLLHKLRSENHKVILFTQMSKMLDIIEAFANLCGFTYVRLDGATKVADRQLIVDRFNRDRKLFLFISSTRAGGVGINLTGADTVVFFDSDWNPAMDRQAMDRCHRIGQVRDVNVYRLVSEKTIEENIFIKQLQKRKLDQVVMDKGHFEDSVENKFIEQVFEESSDFAKKDIYGTHVLWERPSEDSDEFLGPEILATVEDPEDRVARVTEKPDEGDSQYLKLPEIVRHSVAWLESLLVVETGEESEWEDLENAQWESDHCEEEESTSE